MDSHLCEVMETAVVDSLMLTAVPAEGMDMTNEFDVVLTFNRAVTVAEGDITGGTVTPGTAAEFIVTMSGADMDTLMLMVGSTIMDDAGNAFAGESFTYYVGDNTAPALTAMTPSAETITDNHPVFTMTFDDDVLTAAAAGNLVVTAEGAATASLTIPITGDMISGNTVTVSYVYNAETGGLDKNTTYVVTVDGGIIADAAGNTWDGVADASWKFTTGADFATRVDDPSALEFNVYPNPFNDHIFIDNADRLARVVISNIAGQRVMDIAYPTREIRTNSLVSGIYLVSMITDEGTAKVAKIIKK